MLRLVFQPRLQLPQRDRPVADAVLFLLVHLGEGLAFAFEDGIPALHIARQYGNSPPILGHQANIPKLVGPRAGTILPYTPSTTPAPEAEISRIMAYRDSPLEDNRFMTGTLTVSKGTHSLGALILIGEKQIIKALMAKRLEEPFAEDDISAPYPQQSGSAYIYGPGNSFKALKHRHVSSTSTGPCTFNGQCWL